jgi:hypothetical protein
MDWLRRGGSELASLVHVCGAAARIACSAFSHDRPENVFYACATDALEGVRLTACLLRAQTRNLARRFLRSSTGPGSASMHPIVFAGAGVSLRDLPARAARMVKAGTGTVQRAKCQISRVRGAHTSDRFSLAGGFVRFGCAWNTRGKPQPFELTRLAVCVWMPIDRTTLPQLRARNNRFSQQINNACMCSY